MGEHKNWFARNKGFVFGFAVAVAILNIVIFVLMPQQTPIRIDETVTEYVCGDESFAAEHTIQLTGTLTRSMLAKPLFLGTLRISGVDALAARLDAIWRIVHRRGQGPRRASHPAHAGRGAAALPRARRGIPPGCDDAAVHVLSVISHKISDINLCVSFITALDFSASNAYTAAVIESQSKKLHGRQ